MSDGDHPVDAAADQQPTRGDQADRNAPAPTPGDQAGAGAPSGAPTGAGPDAPTGGPGVEDPAAAAADELVDSGSGVGSGPLAEADLRAEADDQHAEDPMTALAFERDDYRDALIRMQADFENYKKRMMKQQTDHLERAAGALVEKLLPVLDTADLALAHGSGEDVKQLAGTLSGVLEREGLERLEPLGTPFDPTLHDAVAHEPGEGGQEVVEVLRAGYRWKGKVLRPAMVKVRG